MRRAKYCSKVATLPSFPALHRENQQPLDALNVRNLLPEITNDVFTPLALMRLVRSVQRFSTQNMYHHPLQKNGCVQSVRSVFCLFISTIKEYPFDMRLWVKHGLRIIRSYCSVSPFLAIVTFFATTLRSVEACCGIFEWRHKLQKVYWYWEYSPRFRTLMARDPRPQQAQ